MAISGGHVFVDESKARGYIMVAGTVPASEVRAARSTMRSLLLPGQERIHFKQERDSRRRQIVGVAAHLPVSARIYVSDIHDQPRARAACLDAIISDALADRAALIAIELDAAARQADDRHLWHRLRRSDSIRYHHVAARSDPLLWISDALAWCHQRGGDWARLIEPAVAEVRHL